MVKYNKSNVKAEELMGLIKEMEKSYTEAAEHYDKAFKMSNKRVFSLVFFLLDL